MIDMHTNHHKPDKDKKHTDSHRHTHTHASMHVCMPTHTETIHIPVYLYMKGVLVAGKMYLLHPYAVEIGTSSLPGSLQGIKQTRRNS